MLRDITKLRIESDKAMPPIDLESKIEQPKAAEPKLTAVEIPSANTAPASIETTKPVTTTPVAPSVNQITATPTAAVVEPKKVAEPAIPVENAAPKSSEKTPQPAVIKPVVVH
jgi:hypothetical protein